MRDDGPWADYFRLQRLAESRVLSDQYWAIDEALEVVLDEIDGEHAIAERRTANLLANRAAKHRHRRRLLNQNACLLSPGVVNEHARFEASRELERHRSRCAPREWRVLLMICVGHTYVAVAAFEGVPEATIKTWVRRARMKLAA